MINAISIALSGLQAAAKRIGASASNIANITTSGSLEDGGKAPYHALTTTQRSQAVGSEGAGVIAEITPKNVDHVPVYDPSSVYANEQGLVGMPNVDLAEEAVNIMMAETAYKASLKTIDAQSRLDKELLNILDERA